MTLSLSPQVFAITSQLIEEATGIHFDPKDADLLAERLTRRASELELESLLDYYYFLRYDPAGARELDALIEQLVVNETYFFREEDQLRVFVERLLPPWLEDRPRVRVWCAASSTGEEPYTLAMLLDDAGLLPRVDILATDISTRVLARATAGVYRGRALRALGDGARLRHFVEEGDGTVRVRQTIRDAVRFQRTNLVDADQVEALGVFDAIVCRNVFIYFRDETVVRLVDRFSRSLPRGGLLLVGASESLLRFGTKYACEEHGGAFFYRKIDP